MSLNNLPPTMAEVAAARAGKPLVKPIPAPIAKKERQKAKADKDEAFREAIWARDKGKSRATGRKLARGGTTDWDKLGEVDHVINRSTAPDRIYDLTNGILLSKTENRMKKVRCPEAVEFFMFSIDGPDDRSKPQKFTWRDKVGNVVKERIG